MDLPALTEKAMALRERFTAAAQRHGRPAWSREEVMQGFVGDVGDLMKLVMAKQGIRAGSDLDAKLGHELADCLWSVLVLARLYRVDLEQEFHRMVDEVSRKLETMNEELDFAAAVAGLLAGDFTRLDPLFVAGTDGSPCAIVRWHEAGRFAREPQALAEAFTCTCFNGRTDVVEYLLARGVDPRGGAATGLNALHWATNRGQLAVVRILLRARAPLEIANSYGGTVLGGAVWAAVHEPQPDHPAIVEALLRAGADVRGAQYPSGDERVDALLREYRR